MPVCESKSKTMTLVHQYVCTPVVWQSVSRLCCGSLLSVPRRSWKRCWGRWTVTEWSTSRSWSDRRNCWTRGQRRSTNWKVFIHPGSSPSLRVTCSHRFMSVHQIWSYSQQSLAELSRKPGNRGKQLACRCPKVTKSTCQQLKSSLIKKKVNTCFPSRLSTCRNTSRLRVTTPG